MSARCWHVLVLALTACGGRAPTEEHDEHEGAEAEHGDEGPREVTLSEQAMVRAAVEVGVAERRVVFGGTWIPAEVHLDPSRTASVAPLIEGRVVSVAVAVGDRVARGEELAVLASAEAGQVRANEGQARARLDAARLAAARQEQLVREGIGSQRALVEAQTEVRQAEAEVAGLAGAIGVYGGARGRGARISLTSPIDGIVVEQRASLGETTGPDRPTFVVSDPSRVWIVGNVPELDVERVGLGSPATLKLGAYPEGSWPVVIDFVAPSLDEASRTLPVRAELDNPDGRLRAGLFGRLEIARGDERGVLAVPVSALARVDGEDVVFVPTDEPRTYRPAPVRLGQRDARFVEVEDGLMEGDAVVTRGAFTLRSELSRGQLADGHGH